MTAINKDLQDLRDTNEDLQAMNKALRDDNDRLNEALDEFHKAWDEFRREIGEIDDPEKRTLIDDLATLIGALLSIVEKVLVGLWWAMVAGGVILLVGFALAWAYKAVTGLI